MQSSKKDTTITNMLFHFSIITMILIQNKVKIYYIFSQKIFFKFYCI